MTVVNLYVDPTSPATFDWLKGISIDDVELSARSYNGLKMCGVRNLYDAQTVLASRQFHEQRNIGSKSVREVKEVIWDAMYRMPPPPEAVRHRNRLELNSLLLSYERHVLLLYCLQRDDTVGHVNTKYDAAITEAKARIERIRERILAYANKD